MTIHKYPTRGKVIAIGDFNGHLEGRLFIKLNDTKSSGLYKIIHNHLLVTFDSHVGKPNH